MAAAVPAGEAMVVEDMVPQQPAAPKPTKATKALHVERPERTQKVKAIQFSILSSKDVVQVSELHVSERNLYEMPVRAPKPCGLLDPRLGTSDKKLQCQTCGGQLKECSGHFGHIALELPVFHIGYFKHTLSVLQCICKSCARVLLTDDERAVFHSMLRRGRGDGEGNLRRVWPGQGL